MPLAPVNDAEFDELRLEVARDVADLDRTDRSLRAQALRRAQDQCTFARAWGALASAFGSFPRVHVERTPEEREVGDRMAAQALEAVAAEGRRQALAAVVWRAAARKAREKRSA